MNDSFKTKSRLKVGSSSVTIWSLKTLEKKYPNVKKLPYSLRILLENLLRHEDGRSVTHEDIEALATRDVRKSTDREIAFRPARVLLQDFTGVPAVVDLAAMREALASMGGNPEKINPLAPADLVIDHSVIVDSSRPRGLSGRMPRSSSTATASATRSSAGARPHSATTASCRLTQGSATR